MFEAQTKPLIDFYKAQGKEIGGSLVEDDRVEIELLDPAEGIAPGQAAEARRMVTLTGVGGVGKSLKMGKALLALLQ